MKIVIITICTCFMSICTYSQTNTSNHTVNGNNNNVEVNGDVNINKPILFSPTELKEILDSIKSKQIKYGVNKVGISIMQDSNAGEAALQVQDYLTNQGCVIGAMSEDVGKMFRGIRLSREPGMIFITFGMIQ